MQLTPKADLSIAEIVFYAPSFCLGVFIVVRHGAARQQGWVYIVLLSILRIIGAACILSAVTQNDSSVGLLTTAAITSAIGTAPLLLALMGILQRMHESMNRRADAREGGGLPQIVFRTLTLFATIGLVVAIVGGSYESSTSSDQGGSTGQDCLEAGSIIFLTLYVVLAGITLLTLLRASLVLKNETKLLYAGLASLPFLLVRVIYTVLVGFASPGSDFNFGNVNVWAEAFMQFLMEAIVLVLFITAGLLTPRKPMYSPANDTVSGGKSAPLRSDGLDAAQLSDGYPMGPPPQQRQPRNLGDYRPSRLIYNAIQDRR